MKISEHVKDRFTLTAPEQPDKSIRKRSEPATVPQQKALKSYEGQGKGLGNR